MINSTWDNARLSRMMLGTVQFGMTYGVANQVGQPSYRDVLAMVAAAVEGGVNCFDTAAAYGSSEEVLGQALSELGCTDKVMVVTKVRPLTADELQDAALAATAIEQSVAESRRRLRLDCLPLVLFHREADAAHWQALVRLRDRGWLQAFGVSCDNRPGPAIDFANLGSMAALQVPANLVDRRHQRSGLFTVAAAQGVALFIRSVYLQGLLVMPEATIPAALGDIVPWRRRLASIAERAGLTLAELALRYILSQAGVTCVLTGVETAAQVEDNLSMFARGPLSADILTAIDGAIPELPETLITPALWPQAP